MRACALRRALVTAAAFACMAGTPGFAATLQQTANFGFVHAGSVSSGAVSVGGTFNRSQVTTAPSITVPRFDASLGTLTGVDVTIRTTTTTFSVAPSGLVSLIGNASATRTLAYVATAGTITDSGSNAASTAGPTLVTLLGLGNAEIGGATLAGTKSYTLAADLAQFTGVGNVAFALTATDAFSVTTLVSALNGAGFTGSGTYAGSVGVTYTYTPVQAVYGTVYADTNHDRVLDGSEAGIGQTAYVKLASLVAGACRSPATAVVAADPASGAYSFGNVTAGSYCLIASNNATASDVAASRPAGRVGTEAPTGIRTIVVATAPLGPQNFGLYDGTSIGGFVFADTGAGSGIANNGIQDGAEAGTAGITVVVRQGGTTVDSAVTGSTGAYGLWIPAGTSGSVMVGAMLPTGLLATGGAPGTSGGTYARATNATTFTIVPGAAASDVDFGVVPISTLQPDGAQTVVAGTTVGYAHVFVAGSVGQVTFSTTASASPSSVRWTEGLWLDTNCNGVVDANEAVVAGPLAVTAGQRLCLVVRENAPANAPLDAHDAVTLVATMTHANATPALTTTLTRVDTTTVGNAVTLTLAKLVRNITTGGGLAATNNASPNDVLEYQVTATNLSAGSVANMSVNDATPPYTTFVSAACPALLPVTVGACAITGQPAAGTNGSVQWTITGLGAGASVTVALQVRVVQ